MPYELITLLAPLGSNARPGYKLNKQNGVTIHMTDNYNNGAGAKNHALYLRGVGSKTDPSWHYSVDDTFIVQSIPDDEVAHHSETTIGNYNTIAIEICLNPDSNLEQACDNAAKFAAIKLREFGLGIDKLYRHYDWSRKKCPSEMFKKNPYSWTVFKNRVKKYLNSVNKGFDVGRMVSFYGMDHCYATSNGEGKGMIPPEGDYAITHFNPGAKYPIHIGSYGWVSESSCELIEHEYKVGLTVRFNGQTPCYATSNGEGEGMIPDEDIYRITHVNPGAKYPIHIGTYGWVSESSCKLI